MDSDLLTKRLIDMAKKSYSDNIFLFSDFLTIDEFSEFEKQKRELYGITYFTYGGYDMAERRMIRFGNPEEMGYLVPFPIECVKISPVSEKFAATLTHRDYLGAIMSLGVERRVFGDIVVKMKDAYIFCETKFSEFLIQNLVSVGRNFVTVSVCEFPDSDVIFKKELTHIQVSSARADAVIAHVCHMARGNVPPLFLKGFVTLNGKTLEARDKMLKEGDIFSVRGYGKFVVGETTGQSKKGKDCIDIYKYV